MNLFLRTVNNMESIKVLDAMTKNVLVLPITATLADAAKLMKDKKISACPILEKGKAVCIITTTDMLNIYASGQKERHLDPWTPISECMSKPVIKISPSDSLKNAAKIMSERHIHHLIVADEEDKILGILSSLDITRAQIQADEK